MLVVDTNIIFPYLVSSALTEEVEALYRLDSVWSTDAFVLIELSNVLATYEKAGRLTLTEALACIEQAESWLTPRFIPVAHATVLELAVHYRITAYDARFLAAAIRCSQKLVTEDKKLRAAAPALTQSIEEALGAA